METLIKNGNVVFADEVRAADVLIRGEKIAAILEPGQYSGPARILDAAGQFVMPGTIDPHMHMGLYRPLADGFRLDTPRQAVGGVTSLISYHRGRGDYFETVKTAIADGEENSLIDFGYSLGVCDREHLHQIEGFVKELGITSFKFYFDKQDIAAAFYGLEPERAMTLDRADFVRTVRSLRAVSEKLLLCVHCEDADLFRGAQEDLDKAALAGQGLHAWNLARPGMAETACLMDCMWLNSVLDGNIYAVHTASASSVKMYELLRPALGGRVTLETCPQYLTLTEDSPCGLLGKVNPPLHTPMDNEALWEGIRRGTVKTMGTDNCPGDKSKKYERGTDVWSVFPGFDGAGMILPVLMSEGYRKRGIPLTTLSKVNSTNAAEVFNLPQKGRVAVGMDADLVIVDPTWERTIGPELYGDSDFSIYDGMTLTGWPRYTLSRGEVIQKDGVVLAKPGRGRYLRRSV